MELAKSFTGYSEDLTALEFFCGIGLAREGMRLAGVRTIWANDVDKTKCALYAAQWGDEHLVCGDVFSIDPNEVPSGDIAWASSPCTDLSLAGRREGLVRGAQSSAFFGFISVIEGMGNRKPSAVILENVCGLATSHNGDDFRIVVKAFNKLGYSVDAFELNAQRWLPQSRPRMFVVGLLQPLDGGEASSPVRPNRISWIHSDPSLRTHLTPFASLPALTGQGFTAMAERLDRDDPSWWSDEHVDGFLDSLSDVQRARFDSLLADDGFKARTAYRRTRQGRPVWEMRKDDIAGCLRTSRGGSSRQAVVCFENGNARIRWMTGQEYALLQGAGGFKLDGFTQPQIKYAFGDAVAVPAVRWLMENAVIPSLKGKAGKEDGRVEVNRVCRGNNGESWRTLASKSAKRCLFG